MMKKLLVLLLVFSYIPRVESQNFSATKDDPLFTTYAAPLARSDYRTDQGYTLRWNDPESGIEFTSRQGPNHGLAFGEGKEIRLSLSGMYKEPVITDSYSDLVSYHYYPLKGVRTEVFFSVYSSKEAILDITLKNEDTFTREFDVYPYLWFLSSDSTKDVHPGILPGTWEFRIIKTRDSWMKEHSIPVTEDHSGTFTTDLRFDSVITFSGISKDQTPIVQEIISSALKQKKNPGNISGLAGCRHFRLSPGDITKFRIIIILDKKEKEISGDQISNLFRVDAGKLLKEDEKLYSTLPRLKTSSEDLRLFWYSCFSLMRQCMMPPEGECKTNYYVFSREPRWGWGYGGQVFHESLAMLAYAYMDPEGAMNSQRVYFDRQHRDGYINYRTGPYLNEDIPYDSTLTTSAPWLNYQNLEIYKITRDKKFLSEAYEAGRKFYRFYVSKRDSNSNGLCEWGGEASLESVRDARVAVWDQVGWPSNFEGPDVNSMLVMEARALSEMAKILGKNDEAALWIKDADRRSDMINWFMWDEGTSFYYNVSRKDQSFTFKNENDLKVKEIIGFLPYWAGVSDPEKSEKLEKVLKDPEEFWRHYGIPTLSAKEPYYNPIGYWNGPVWVQWNYLVFRGMLDHGDTAGARTLAEKVINNIIFHLKNDHTFWEFYSPDDRQAGWNATYIWAGIAARFLTDLGMTEQKRSKP